MSVRKFLSGIRFDAGQKEGRIIFRLVNSLFFVSLISLMTVLVGSILDGLIISNFLRETAFAAFGLSSPLTNLVELMGHVVATGCVVTCGNLIGAGKAHSVDIKLFVRDGQITLRLRDDCRVFDTRRRAAIMAPEDAAANIGIRILRSIARDVEYYSMLDMNYLTMHI